MSDALEQHRKECEEMKLAGMIWWLIIWFASKEGKEYIPSEQEWLSCELVAAIIEEVTKEDQQFSWRHDEFGRERNHDHREWPEMLNAKLERCDWHYHSKFDGSSIISTMRGLLKRFVRYTPQYEHSESWCDSELKLFHVNTTPTTIGHSRFKPQREMYGKAVDELLRYTSAQHADVCEWCRTIGTLMRPYIERDVAYIKKRYSW